MELWTWCPRLPLSLFLHTYKAVVGAPHSLQARLISLVAEERRCPSWGVGRFLRLRLTFRYNFVLFN